MQSLIGIDRAGRYILNVKGCAELEATRVMEQYGWQKRSLLLNLIVYVLVNAWALVNFSLSSSFLIIICPLTLWLVFYSYGTLVHRRFSLRQKVLLKKNIFV